MSCDYLDCDALIKSYAEANTRLQGRLDQQDLLVSAQKKRILELINESDNQILDLRDEREITKDLRQDKSNQADTIYALRAEIIDKNKRILDAQQERMALLVANKAHQETNETLQKTVNTLKSTVESLKAALEIAARRLYR
jgi:chromosome segregation ATPase